MSISLPQDALSEDGEIVKYIFRKVENIPDGKYLTEDYPEDSHISFWVGDVPSKAPEGYELLYEPK